MDISTRGIFWAATKPRRESRREQQHLRLFRSEGDNDENWIALPVQFQGYKNLLTYLIMSINKLLLSFDHLYYFRFFKYRTTATRILSRCIKDHQGNESCLIGYS